jgi:hypothetical protein
MRLSITRHKGLHKFDQGQLMVWMNNSMGQDVLGFAVVTNHP